jgi:(4-alkanoyl-5-oxo-2,5-dihydrofuran-3-yl)methyl phosphate reductase
MQYLITGVTGDVGSRVVRRLLEQDIRPRVLVRDNQKAHSLFGERVDTCVGDLSEPESIQSAMRGIDVIYLVNVGPQIPDRDNIAAKIAKAAGVGRIVKLSSLDVEQDLAIGAWHEKGEAAIRASGIPFTFVRPTGFMNNLLAWANSVRREGVVRSSTADGRRPFIHCEDIAAVSLEALLHEAYTGRILSLTGPQSLTFGEVTQMIAEAIGKPLVFEAISDDEARERYSRVSGSEEETEAHVALWRAIREGRVAATTKEVEQILGRKPLPLAQWARENAGAFR